MKDLFEQASKYLQSLPAHFQRDLQHVFPDVYKSAENTIRELQRNDCIIVVAGTLSDLFFVVSASLMIIKK